LIYCLKEKRTPAVIWVLVDNGIVTGLDEAMIKRLKEMLKLSIKIKWSEGLESIVGLSINCSPDGFHLTQLGLVNKILEEQWDGTALARAPFPTEALPETNKGEGIDPTGYLHVIGCLNYLAVATRPDIAFAVNFLARFSQRPSTTHWRFLKHLINYLANTQTVCLSLCPAKGLSPLTCFVDASWAGEKSRSTHGFIVFCFGCPVAWTSRRLATIALSTAHAEYMALGIGVRECLWIRSLVCNILGVEFIVDVLCNNQAAIQVCTDDVSACY
jgi:hypothetical protein